MIERYFRKYLFFCDGKCGALLDSMTGNRQQANYLLRVNGWKHINGCEHYCPACSNLIPMKRAAERAEERKKQPWERWR